MQETTVTPEAKAALARCFAAHKALRSYSAEVLITTRGVPPQKNGRVRIAFVRPGRLRMECDGERGKAGASLLVGVSGYLYEANSPQKSIKTTRVDGAGDPLSVGLEDSNILALPLFEQLMVVPDGMTLFLDSLSSLTLTTERGLLVFHGTGRFELTISFNAKDLLLREVRLQGGGKLPGNDFYAIELREVYQNIRLNPALPSALWRFVPPAGYTNRDDKDNNKEHHH